MFNKHLGKKKKLSEDTVVGSDEGENSSKEPLPAADTDDGLFTEARANAEGETFFELSSTRRVTLRQWKSRMLVDIREFWGDADSLKPGKKGISLTAEQWKQLVRIAPIISKRLEDAPADS